MYSYKFNTQIIHLLIHHIIHIVRLISVITFWKRLQFWKY